MTTPEITTKQKIKMAVLFLAPKLGYALRFTVTDDEAMDFGSEVLKKALRERRMSKDKKKE